MEKKHAPLPYRYSDSLEEFGIVWAGNQALFDASSNNLDSDTQRANAEFIVRACNSHYELLELVKDYKSLLFSDYVGSRDYSGGQLGKCEAAISKAEGK